MQHVFELYLMSDQVTEKQWLKFYNVITKHIGGLAKCEIIVGLKDNVVCFYIASDKDLGQLSNNIDLGVLRPVTWEEVGLPKDAAKEGFVNFVTGGNLLDLKERLGVKRGKQLEYAAFNFRRVTNTRSIVNFQLYFKDAANQWSVAKKMAANFPAHLFAIDFAANTHYLRKTSPKYLSIEKTLHLFEPENVNAVFSVSTFPYFPKDYYLPLTSYEFDKHSFIVGATGSGKSKFIQLFVERLAQSQLKMNYRVIIVDPHDSMRQELEDLPDTHIVNFANESAQLFGDEVQTDVTAATELTTSLMKSLLADQFNARLERVLKFSLFVLFVGQTMSLGFLKRFLTNLELRNQLIQHVEGHVPANIRQFFATDFNEIRTTHYNEAILPIVSLVDELELQPTLVGESEQSLAKLIQSNFLTVFSLNKVSMGDKVVKTVAGLLIQQIFLLAQARAFNERVILVIDEVSVIQNPAIASILAEARKFNLSVVLSQQYFGQVEKDLRDAIFANVYNYYAFRVSEEDAQTLAGNLGMEIPKEIIEAEAAKGIKEEQIKVKLLTELHPRECMVRISAGGQVLPCFKARTVDANTKQNTHDVKAKELKTYQKTNQPKLDKFVESSTGQYKPLPVTPVPPSPVAQGADVPSVLEERGEEPAQVEHLQTEGVAFGGSLNPEADISVYTNPELDADARKAKKQNMEEAANKLGSMVANKTGLSDPYDQPTISLSELLASQSSSRDN